MGRFNFRALSSKNLNNEAYKHMSKLLDHTKHCRELRTLFHKLSEIDGAFISSSGPAGGMDFFARLLTQKKKFGPNIGTLNFRRGFTAWM